jgi:hypothetical protein
MRIRIKSSFEGGGNLMVRYLKAVGGAVIGIGANIIWTLRLLWYLGFLFITALLVYDLCRIPVSVNSSHKYALERTLWAKMSPEEEQRLIELQEHCHHVSVHHGYVTYYCALCRKKLVEGTVPLTQL